MEETLFQPPDEEPRILHECWYHLQSKFCRNNLSAVCWRCPIQQADMHPFALATQRDLSRKCLQAQQTDSKDKGKIDYQTQWLQGHLCIYFICLNICLNNSTGDRTFRVLPIKMPTTPSDII